MFSYKTLPALDAPELTRIVSFCSLQLKVNVDPFLATRTSSHPANDVTRTASVACDVWRCPVTSAPRTGRSSDIIRTFGRHGYRYRKVIHAPPRLPNSLRLKSLSSSNPSLWTLAPPPWPLHPPSSTSLITHVSNYLPAVDWDKLNNSLRAPETPWRSDKHSFTAIFPACWRPQPTWAHLMKPQVNRRHRC